MATTLNASTSLGYQMTPDSSGVLQLQTANTTAVTIDASQNVSTVNTINVPNTFGFKNRIINGQGLVNQRTVSGTVTLAAGVYGHDRFKAGASGCTYTFATSANVTTFTITAGSLIQVIEGLNLETGTYCLSWTGTVQGKIGAGSYSASGITGSITGGTNTNVEFNTGTLSLPQLEKGSTATSFDYRPYGTELNLCERYYQSGFFHYFAANLSSGDATFTFPVNFRTNPTSYAFYDNLGAVSKYTDSTGNGQAYAIDASSIQAKQWTVQTILARVAAWAQFTWIASAEL